MVKITPDEANLRRLRRMPRNLGEAVRMDDPYLLRLLGAEHREQVAANFRTEGLTGARGPFAALSPKYAKRKARFVGSRKILDLTGDTKRRFTMATHPDYIARFYPAARRGGTFVFGARSDVGAAHVHGRPRLVTSRVSLPKLFVGVAKRLPVRDFITKTPANLAAMRRVLRVWFNQRLEQFIRAGGRA